MNLTDVGASGGLSDHDIARAAQRGHHARAVYRQRRPREPAQVLIVPDILAQRSSPSPLKAIKEMR